MTPLAEKDVQDINIIARFLAASQVSSLRTCPAVDVVVLCGNAILPITETLFDGLEHRADLAKTLVICGGIGHSTQYLYDAVGNHWRYRGLHSEIEGLPEAAVLELMLRRCHLWPAMYVTEETKLIVEEKSQNCGANAIETRRVLEQHGKPVPRSVIVVQDPTMSLRTVAAFQHTYQDVSPPIEFLACPTLIPQMRLNEDGEAYISATQHQLAHQWASESIESSHLWTNDRFLDLLMGEIPRLRDDENGYGPRGKDFIVHVDIPAEVESAWERLSEVLKSKR